MILLIDLNWKKNSLGYDEFVVPILTLAERLDSCTVKHYLDVTSQDLNHCNNIILSGNALKDKAFMSEAEKFLWLRQTEKPVLGICAGMEIIGLIFGARLDPLLEIGMTQITSVKDNPLFCGEFKAYSLHNYCIEPADMFDILAKSTKCVQAIRHKSKKLFGVLFHPEVRNQEIVSNFISQ